MSLMSVNPPPGVYAQATAFQAGASLGGGEPRWVRASLVRWRGAKLAPVGGWRKPSANTVSGLARSIVTWPVSGGARWIGIGTHTGLYARSPSGVLSNITPVSFAVGLADETANTGFGIGPFGTGSFGAPRPDTGSVTEALVWDLAIDGEQLLACAFSDGRIVRWDLNTGVPAAALLHAPTGCRGLVVTDEGFPLALGAGGNPRRIQWPDQFDHTDWTPSAANQAGDVDLVTEGKIKRAICLGARTLVLTDVDAHAGEYRGLPAVYEFQQVGKNCGAISKGCIAPMGQQAMWWSRSGFWLFDGSSTTAVECDVYDYLVENLNPGQRSKITAFHNHEFGEVWWFYPSRAGIECDSYVSFDYRRNHWGTGVLARSCAAAPGVFQFPLMIDPSGGVWEHEAGSSYPDAGGGASVIFAETAPLRLGAGDGAIRIDELILDEGVEGLVTLSFLSRPYPNGDEAATPDVQLDGDGRGFPRFEGRLVRLRAVFASNDNARLGSILLAAKPAGRR